MELQFVGDAGDLDANFDGDGKVVTDFPGAGDQAFALALQPDGKIVLAGSVLKADATFDIVLMRHNPDGSLDNTFDQDGKVSTDFGGDQQAFAVILQPDGKILAAGTSQNDFVIARYNSNGSVDSSFGSGGRVTTDFATSVDRILAIALQPDGKIVAAGTSGIANTFDFALARYSSNGSLDTSFSFDGKLTTDLGAPPATGEEATALAIQTNGKIIAAGLTLSGPKFDFALVRYNTDGTLDNSFSSDGRVLTDFDGFDDAVFDVLLQPDGKIIAAGLTESASNNQNMGLARYNPDGSLDNNFSADGKASVDFFGNSDDGRAVARQADGKIVIAGNMGPDFALARFTSTGDLDLSFSQDGRVTTDFGASLDQASDVAIQTDGKIIVAGSVGFNSNRQFAMARYEGDPAPPAIFSDDYENGILASDWTYVKPNWIESAGNLTGIPTGKSAEVIAAPAFGGCSVCNMEASIQTTGGPGSKLWFLTWFVDKRNTVEVLMKEANDKWILRQRVNGSLVAKTKGIATILPNVFYDVKVTFDGVNFELFVDGVSLATLPASAAPNGTLGFRVKNTTGRFGFVIVN